MDLEIEIVESKKSFIVEIMVPNAGFYSNPVTGCPLRALWAGLIGIVTSFGSEARESPPSAARADDYRAQALTPTVLHAALSDLTCAMQRGRLPKEVAISYRVSQQCSQRRRVHGCE